ncbi:MAG: YccF domain-containing protein [Ruminococcaceae bacterium]|nr:YccF domain-containing protein [Oscillospiraceae bacterium]
MLRLISNVLWALLGGIWLFILWGALGLLLCLTVVGIPFGKQCFKIARLSFMPYGKKVRLNYKKHPLANVVWAVFLGWEVALVHFAVGVLNCITIIGISRGIQCFKIMKLALLPFGAKLKR